MATTSTTLAPIISVSPLKTWDLLTKASDASALVPTLPDSANQTLLFLSGDYWQGWACWAGTQIPASVENRASIMAEIERSFVPRPLIEEVSERGVAGLVGQEPAFEFVSARDGRADQVALDALAKMKDVLRQQTSSSTQDASTAPSADGLDIISEMQGALGLEVEDDFLLPDGLSPAWKKVIEGAKVVQKDVAQEAAFVGEINAAFGSWWDKRKGHELLQDFTRQLFATGRASLRFYIPSGLLGDNGQVKVKGWVEALDLIYLEVPEPASATVAINRGQRKSASVFSYKDTDEKGEDISLVEVTFLADDGKTTIRILEGDAIRANGEITHDCGGELFVDEAVTQPLISAATIRNQNALNVVNTMLLHNSNLAGHRERNFFNVQKPSVEVDDPANPGKKKRVDAPLTVGAGASNFHTGVVYTQDGKTMLAPGNMVITDPVDPKPLIEALSQFEDNIYAAVSQRHVKISGDATASAVARIQARYEFLSFLKKASPKVEGVLRSRMRGVVALAMTLAKDKRLEQFKQLRASVVCHLNTGPLTPEEKTEIISEYDKGIIPLETAQILLGREDVDALADGLRKQQSSSLTALVQRATAMQALTAAGAGVEAAASIAGFGDDEAKLLAKGDFTDEEEEDAQ